MTTLARHLVNILIFLFAIISSTNGVASKQCVILLHGMGRSHYSMDAMEAFLKAHDYIVVNKSYHSMQQPIEHLAAVELPIMIAECAKLNPDKINFVTHSLGGIVLREYLQNNSIPNLGRIVMLSPPNHGSPLADFFKYNPLYRIIMGPAGQQLATDRSSLPNSLPQTSSYQIGIITGSYNATGDLFFNETSDGVVSAASAKLIGMQDFIVMPFSHSFIMQHKEVMEQVLVFLRSGKFKHLVS